METLVSTRAEILFSQKKAFKSDQWEKEKRSSRGEFLKRKAETEDGLRPLEIPMTKKKQKNPFRK